MASERELTESSSEGLSALREFSSAPLPGEGSRIGWPFKTDSQLSEWVEEEEVAVMAEEPQRSTHGLQARLCFGRSVLVVISVLAYASSTL